VEKKALNEGLSQKGALVWGLLFLFLPVEFLFQVQVEIVPVLGGVACAGLVGLAFFPDVLEIFLSRFAAVKFKDVGHFMLLFACHEMSVHIHINLLLLLLHSVYRHNKPIEKIVNYLLKKQEIGLDMAGHSKTLPEA
jgi:hypothetical protein